MEEGKIELNFKATSYFETC